MHSDLVSVTVKGLMPTSSGCAVFFTAGKKTFVIHMDPNMGLAISLYLQHLHKDRPLTHDLIASILFGFGITLEHIVINNVEDSTFYARIILSMKNELGSKLVEIDARPSDAVVLALQMERPMFVSKQVLIQVEDISELLEKLYKENNPDGNNPGGPLLF